MFVFGSVERLALNFRPEQSEGPLESTFLKTFLSLSASAQLLCAITFEGFAQILPGFFRKFSITIIQVPFVIEDDG